MRKDCAEAKGFITQVSYGLPIFPGLMLQLATIVCDGTYIFSKVVRDRVSK